MTVYEQLRAVCDGNPGKVYSTKTLRTLMKENYGRNANSVLLADFSYNRTNHGLGEKSSQPLFRFIERGRYEYLGPNYPYNGEMLAKPVGGEERVVGVWTDGVFEAKPPR